MREYLEFQNLRAGIRQRLKGTGYRVSRIQYPDYATPPDFDSDFFRIKKGICGETEAHVEFTRPSHDIVLNIFTSKDKSTNSDFIEEVVRASDSQVIVIK